MRCRACPAHLSTQERIAYGSLCEDCWTCIKARMPGAYINARKPQPKPPSVSSKKKGKSNGKAQNQDT